MSKYSKFDSALANLGLLLMGGFWFGVLYGITCDDMVAFKYGMIIFGVICIIATYIIIKYKTWRRKW